MKLDLAGSPWCQECLRTPRTVGVDDDLVVPTRWTGSWAGAVSNARMGSAAEPGSTFPGGIQGRQERSEPVATLVERSPRLPGPHAR